MQFRGLTYTVGVELTFTSHEAEYLAACAKSHYDYKCRQAALRIGDAGASENGFIAQLVMFGDLPTVHWSVEQLDLALKVLEVRASDVETHYPLQKVLALSLALAQARAADLVVRG